MSLQTPDKIRTLQRKLYLKAKAEPDFRFYLLYDKTYREDILRHAYDLMRANNGAPGVDGVTFAMIEADGLEEWLSGIRKELIEKTYRPAPVRRVMIPKPGGNGERPLGIPTIRDQTVQAAAKLVLEPIFEADLDPSAYGYRPKRGGHDAIKEVHALICRGYTDVVDADLSKYFDTIPHLELMQCHPGLPRRGHLAPVMCTHDQPLRPLQNRHLPLLLPHRGPDARRRLVRGRPAHARHAAPGGARENHPVDPDEAPARRQSAC